MPLILRRQRQVELCELEVSLVYIVSSMTNPKATQRNQVSNNPLAPQKVRRFVCLK